ncbi:MAG: BrnT family toxin [Gammaproteobacteria bacterium]|nr:BrnT family toxin [Gammaproteobacteria bacterium]
MDVSFDPAKDVRNVALRGISLARATDFDWNNALIVEDTRKDYGEPRYQALGLIDDRLHMLIFTPRTGKTHIISLRKANDREIRRYEETKTQP